MYIVTVFHNGMALDKREFKFGTWAEIGFWLDYYGYNDPAYRLTVKFVG